MTIRGAFKRMLRRADVAVTRHSTLAQLQEDSGAAEALEFIFAMPRTSVPELLEHWGASRSQNRQDLFALCELGFKRGGYFVELGATDGLMGSNCWLMEKQFGWTGVAVEPARGWHAALRGNRGCAIDTDCVWRESGVPITFNEVDELPALSTIDTFSDVDRYADKRKGGRTYQLTSVSLNDLLARHRAPRDIDFLSIDTEGSELEILRGFDFARHRIRVITCEHNHTPAREEIRALLVEGGYRRKHENLSKYDDWYTLED